MKRGIASLSIQALGNWHFTTLPPRTQPATPWTGGTWVSPLNSIPPIFSDSDTGIHPVTFKCTHRAPDMQEQQKQETAGFLNKDSSVRNPGHDVIHALSVSELQELARQLVQQTPFLSVCLSVYPSVYLQELQNQIAGFKSWFLYCLAA